MTKQIEAMKLALEFIEYHSMYWNGTGSHPQSIVTALREVLDEPVQERRVQQQFMDEEILYLYTPRREWVSLTDEEIYGEGNNHEKVAKDGSGWFDRGSFARAIDELLRTKNEQA